MNRHITTAVVILAISSVAGSAVNLLRPASLQWIRSDMSDAAKPKTDGAGITPTTANQLAAKDSQSESTPPAESGLSADAVLTHLRTGTARFVDAREEREYVVGHIKGAINIPSSAIYQHIGKLIEQVPPSEKIIIYCGGGDCEASHHVSDALQRDFKFEDVSIYVKGWSEFEARRTDLFNDWISVGTEP